MEPEPSAGAATVGAFRHCGGNLEVCVQVPGASLVDGEDSKVLRFDGVGVRVVSDGECASAKVIYARSVELRERLARARVIGLVLGASVTAGDVEVG